MLFALAEDRKLAKVAVDFNFLGTAWNDLESESRILRTIGPQISQASPSGRTDSMGFQTPQYQLADLLRRAAAGKIQLPDFQRGYKWDEERIAHCWSR